jgi:hypothetical protein
VLKQLKNSGAESIPFVKLDKILRNAGVQQFSYETFTAAFQQDPRLKTLVNNFNSEEIIFKQPGMQGGSAEPGQDAIGQMAQRATNLGDKL